MRGGWCFLELGRDWWVLKVRWEWCVPKAWRGWHVLVLWCALKMRRGGEGVKGWERGVLNVKGSCALKISGWRIPRLDGGRVEHSVNGGFEGLGGAAAVARAVAATPARPSWALRKQVLRRARRGSVAPRIRRVRGARCRRVRGRGGGGGRRALADRGVDGWLRLFLRFRPLLLPPRGEPRLVHRPQLLPQPLRLGAVVQQLPVVGPPARCAGDPRHRRPPLPRG
mmetsp:Transcript_37815/g.91967  ORF Transcript_37815/g.91967 Transcript_37815/m.91967 type:complete len:225 (-) Transcript_37815:262-936(-)